MSAQDKKYQVFVSSTYKDLIPERQEVMHALLELDCIPAGMELFPAADEDQWSLIKGVIDDCDYYLAVIGGRYGSVGPEGLSYTEMEYRYAVESGKPTIAFLHKDPGTLQAKNTEQTAAGKKKLEEFRDLAQKKMCKFWTSAPELGSVVSRSMIMLQKNHPGIGWVRGDQVADTDATAEILRLRREIETLEEELKDSKTEAPVGTESLAQGEDVFEIPCEFHTTLTEDHSLYQWQWSLEVSWNEIFYELSPLMLHEASNLQLWRRFVDLVKKKLPQIMPYNEEFEGHRGIREISAEQSSFDTTLIQFNALGLIVQSVRNRSVKDRGTYWTLTPYGTSVMNRLRAIRKEPG